MRVLYLTYNPNLGSTTRALQDWLSLQKERGDEPAVVVRSQGPFMIWLQENKIAHLQDPMPWPSKYWPFPSLYHAIRIARWAQLQQVEVIHCNEHDAYPFAILLRWLLTLRLACAIHFAVTPRFTSWAFATRMPLLSHVRYAISPLFSRWAFGRHFSRTPDYLLWTSEAQRSGSRDAVEELVAPTKQSVVPLGLSTDHFKSKPEVRSRIRAEYGITDDQVVLGCACAFRRIKRIPDFLSVVETLTSERSNIVGLLAGDAPPGEEHYRAELLPQIQALVDAKKLIWVGNLDKIEDFLQAVDVFVSSSEFETFGMSVCEAMATEKPIVAYAACSVQEVVGDAGIIVETGNLELLIDGARRLVEQPHLRITLGAAARERVRTEFNPKSSLQKLDRIYAQLLSST